MTLYDRLTGGSSTQLHSNEKLLGKGGHGTEKSTCAHAEKCTIFQTFLNYLWRGLLIYRGCAIFHLSIIRRKMHHDDTAVSKAAGAEPTEKSPRRTTAVPDRQRQDPYATLRERVMEGPVRESVLDNGLLCAARVSAVICRDFSIFYHGF
jgi:hypothetical protein